MAWIAEARYQALKGLNALFKKVDISVVFRTRTGIKGFNNRFNRDPLRILDGHAKVDPALLFIGFDAMADAYTLLNTPILDSPHCDFMRRLLEKRDIEGSDYIRRMAMGALDERFATPIAPRRLRRFREKFELRKAELQQGKTHPATVYRVGDKLYLKDGKHRAALACLLGIPLPCRVADADFLLQGTRARQSRAMRRDPDRYRASEAFIQEVMRG